MTVIPSLMITEDWIKPLYKIAGDIPACNFYSDIENEFYGEAQIYYVKGSVPPHTDGSAKDKAFPEYSYLLILRCGRSRVLLMQEEHANLKLQKGLLLELRSWSEHGLLAPPNHRLAWACLDSDVRIPLAVVKQQFMDIKL